MRTKAGTCKDCGQVKVEKREPSHLLHFFLSLFTVGTWLFVWGLVILWPGGWRCAECGRRARAHWFG